MGGGKEVSITVVCFLIWSDRSKFMYYVAVLGLDKMITSYFKLAFAAPRPYMIDSEIKPITCSKGFGNPSGHSSAASMLTIVLFLDTFHGTPYAMNKAFRLFYSNGVYGLCLFACLFWAFTIPFTRFLMGAHSLD